MNRRSKTLGAGVIASLLAGCSPVAIEGGPIAPTSDHGYGGLVVEVGEPFTDGFDVIDIEGASPVTIKAVELVGTDDALQLEGVLLAGPDRAQGAVIQFELVYPPVTEGLGDLIDAEGAVLEKDNGGMSGYELLIGMRATKPGKHFREGFRIVYESDGVTYSRTVRAELTVCAGDEFDPAVDCPMIEREGD